MSKADKMFEDLGYKMRTRGSYIEYCKTNNSVKEEYVISFVMKTVMATLYINGSYLKKPLALEIAELQAINEKVIELGWLVKNV